MPSNRYLNITIDGQPLDLGSADELPITISYRRENTGDFQVKRSTESFNVTVPATLNNDQIGNCFSNPAVEDMTPGSVFRRHRSAVIEANGYELLVGKAFLVGARHASCPVSYEWNFYGNNADWIIPLKEATLYDFLKHLNFTFSRELIEDSWQYDGTDEDLPFVFAPVRYGEPLANKTHIETTGTPPNENDTVVVDAYDYNMLPIYMRPSISVYWLLYWGFKSLGYRIQSNFMDSNFFRRLVMPWTWGNFLFSDGTRLDNLDFLAKSSEEGNLLNVSYTGFFDAHVDNDSNNGAYDNQGVYQYDSGDDFAMKWTYLNTFNYGTLQANFRLSTFIDARATANSDVELYVRWYKNGVQIGNQEEIVYLNAPSVGSRQFLGLVDKHLSVEVEPGDVIACRLYADNFDSGLGRARLRCTVEAFELDYFRIPLGGQIDFSGYPSLKKHKFLDFFAGICDCFNISPATDPINRVVLLEPEHPYSLSGDPTAKAAGYYTGNYLRWDDKQDVSVESDLPLYSDSERELVFRYKEDSNDGLLKKVQDRNQVVLAQSKYVFPDRFKAGKKDVPNRFFAPVVHADMLQWKGFIEGYENRSPQIVAMIPENISNTSRDEAQNTFAPKLCYYKGIDLTVGWVFDAEQFNYYPFMFAVNYMNPSIDDPNLSYADELIDEENELISHGLLRRFYLQRMAIMRNGQFYKTYFRLNNLDATNWFHREHISCRGQKWELVEIVDYKPLQEGSTTCTLRKHTPITEEDSDAVFPSNDSVLGETANLSAFDLKYSRLKCLASDIPKPSNP